MSTILRAEPPFELYSEKEKRRLCGGWIRTSTLVSLAFSLQIVFFFRVPASVHWWSVCHNWARCRKRTAIRSGSILVPRAGRFLVAWSYNLRRVALGTRMVCVRNYILATYWAWTTRVLLASCRVFLEYAKMEQKPPLRNKSNSVDANTYIKTGQVQRGLMVLYNTFVLLQKITLRSQSHFFCCYNTTINYF